MSDELFQWINGKKTDAHLHDISEEDDKEFAERINKMYRQDRDTYVPYHKKDQNK
ncbi:hypothetical protein [Alkalibacillus haloalkaliphilus]|uniref:hypothetical protein n=1 Tax=Alkalibacillus haloalkaliphilus TaxID=94136 RepID=UPI00293664BC|nr:hypothetical protein [Alkalibacillus haloalkaliphilus]MDV2582397.1 hypothetical protein [Alkalibacillus haloalkaliphilus]